jgi:hypothetical protein
MSMIITFDCCCLIYRLERETRVVVDLCTPYNRLSILLFEFEYDVHSISVKYSDDDDDDEQYLFVESKNYLH